MYGISTSRANEATTEPYMELKDGPAFWIEPDRVSNDKSGRNRKRDTIRRNWFYFVPATIILIGVILILVFILIIPAIVQSIVNKQDLPVTSAAFLNPTPDNIQVSLVTSIAGPSISTRLQRFSLSLAGVGQKAFAAVLIGDQKIRGKTNLEVTNQTVAIIDKAAFDSFLALFVYNANFTMKATGSSNMFIGAIKAPIKLNKEIRLAGLANLTDFSLQSPSLLSTPQPDGTNLLATASISNPSLVTFDLGAVTLSLLIANLTIGTAVLPSFLLSPGPNLLPLRATISLPTIAANLQAISAAQPAFTANGTLEIRALGQNVVVAGQRITYYEKVLQPLSFVAKLPVRSLLAGAAGGGGNTTVGTGTSSGNSSSTANGSSATNSTRGGPRLQVSKPIWYDGSAWA